MNLSVTKEAAQWYKNELNLQSGETIRLFLYNTAVAVLCKKDFL